MKKSGLSPHSSIQSSNHPLIPIRPSGHPSIRPSFHPSIRPSVCLPFLALLVLLLIVPASHAQAPSFDGMSTGTTVGFKYYIWGEVRSPGMKMLGAQAEITELLSAAGGPANDADMTRVELIRGVDRKVERINLRDKLESGEGVTLTPGDIVVIPRNFWPRFREGLTLVSGLATILNLALTIVRIAD